MRHPQLINMKHNKYTQFISPSWKSWSTVLKIEISCSQWQSSACTTRGLSFNFWVLGEKGGMGDVFTVLNLFSLCSHQDPNGFLKLLPIEPQFYPILFGHSSTFTYRVCKGRRGRERWPTKCINLLLFWGAGPKRMHLLRTANVPDKSVIGPVSVLASWKKRKQKKKNLWGHPMN